MLILKLFYNFFKNIKLGIGSREYTIVKSRSKLPEERITINLALIKTYIKNSYRIYITNLAINAFDYHILLILNN